MRGMKKSFFIFLGFAIYSFSFLSSCHAIDAWPGGAGINIATYSDASGVVWHEGRQSLFVVQNSGTLVELDSNGTFKDSWAVAGDLEGITLAENDRYLYIGVENPDSILEFDLNAEALTGNSWNLTTWMASVDPNQGLEGLAYRDGYFLAGLQADGKIYVFNVNLSVSGDVDYVETITPYASYASDISAIEYNSKTGIKYALYDSNDALVELNGANEIVHHYSLPGTAQEGIAIKTNCLARVADAYVANDDTGMITKYENYPITCLDADEDGVSYNSDCNDYDAAISASQTYYRDADGDGLGDARTLNSVCSLSAPSGYVANSSDPADISASGRRMYVNGNYHDFFTVDPTTVQYTDQNYFADDWHEIIAVGLVSKKAYITLARVRGSEVAVTKRVMVRIKKKHTSASITTDLSKNKFSTRFGRGKKYTWKVYSTGSFKKSK